jgi:hypothetical protein
LHSLTIQFLHPPTRFSSINSCARLPRSMLDKRTHKQTNEFAAHELLRAATARNGYPA